MKTIEISDELYERLKYLSDEIKTQNNRATADPYFYQILSYDEVPTDSNYEDYAKWIGREDDYYEVENDEDKMKEYLHDNYTEFREVIQEYLDSWDISMLDECDKDDVDNIFELIGFERISIKKIKKYENCFLTEKSIKEHLKFNGYHYSDDRRDYVQYAFRNPDMETIFKFLRGTDFK